MGIDPVGVDENNVHSHIRYAYANNNPYKFVDPDGRSASLALPVAILGTMAVYIGIKGTLDAILQNSSNTNSDEKEKLLGLGNSTASSGGMFPEGDKDNKNNNDKDESNPKVRDEKWFKKQGIDAHDVKKDLGASKRNLAVDKNGRVYTVDRIGSGNKQYVDTLENLKNQSPYKKP